MRRKFKLLASISAFVLCLAMLVFGVYSASQVNYTASGTVNYEIKDVFVEVSTRVYRSTESTLTDSTKLSTVANALKGATASTLAGVLTAQNIEDTGFGMSKDAQNNDVDDTLLSTYDAENNIIANPESTSTKSVTGIPVEYGLYNATNGTAYAYYVVITVNNIGNKVAGVTVSSDMASATLNSNLVSATNKNVAAQTSANFVFGMSLLDPMTEVDSQDFTITVSISKNEVVEPMSFAKKELSECTPLQIQEVGQKGHIDETDNTKWIVGNETWFNVGDEVTMTLTNGTEVVLQVADFNHDVDENGNVLPITFITRDILPETYRHPMNELSINEGGWVESSMREYLNTEIYNLISDEWKQLIKPVRKLTVVGGGTEKNPATTVEESIDKIFLLSYIETGIDSLNSVYLLEGSKYNIFKSGENDEACLSRSKSDAWWLRSPNYQYRGYFDLINWLGGCGNVEADASWINIVFAFCI